MAVAGRRLLCGAAGNGGYSAGTRGGQVSRQSRQDASSPGRTGTRRQSVASPPDVPALAGVAQPAATGTGGGLRGRVNVTWVDADGAVGQASIATGPDRPMVHRRGRRRSIKASNNKDKTRNIAPSSMMKVPEDAVPAADECGPPPPQTF